MQCMRVTHPMTELPASEAMLANIRLALSAVEKDLRHIGDGAALGLTDGEVELLRQRADHYRGRIAQIERKLRGH